MLALDAPSGAPVSLRLPGLRGRPHARLAGRPRAVDVRPAHPAARPPHPGSTRRRLERLAPGLALDGLDRALAYGDAMTDDARLTLAVAATGCAYGGLVLTRAEAIDGRRDRRRRLAGLRAARPRARARRIASMPRLVVNAAGALGRRRARALRSRRAAACARRAAVHLVLAGGRCCRSPPRSPSPRPTTAGRCSSSRTRRGCWWGPPTSSTTATSTTRDRPARRSTTCCGR